MFLAPYRIFMLLTLSLVIPAMPEPSSTQCAAVITCHSSRMETPHTESIEASQGQAWLSRICVPPTTRSSPHGIIRDWPLDEAAQFSSISDKKLPDSGADSRLAFEVFLFLFLFLF